MTWHGTPTPAIRRKSTGLWKQRNERRKIGRRQTMDGYPVLGHSFTKAEVDDYFSGDRIVCLLCGKKYRNLGNHLPRVHSMTGDEYRQRYGLPWTRGLTCEDSHAKYSSASAARVAENPDIFADRLDQYRHLCNSADRRPHQPFHQRMIEDRCRTMNGGESPFTDKDYTKILEELAKNRTVPEVLSDPGRPAGTTWRGYLRDHLAFSMLVNETIERQSFSCQARGGRLGSRFLSAVRETFIAGLSDKEAAARLGVTAMTVNKHTKPWRARVA